MKRINRGTKDDLLSRVISSAFAYVNLVTEQCLVDEENLELVLAVEAYRKNAPEATIQRKERCPKCKSPMVRIVRPANKAIRPGQQYIYSEYDLCKKCKHLQHYEKFKVWLDVPGKSNSGERTYTPPPERPSRSEAAKSQFQPPPGTVFYDEDVPPWDL